MLYVNMYFRAIDTRLSSTMQFKMAHRDGLRYWLILVDAVLPNRYQEFYDFQWKPWDHINF